MPDNRDGNSKAVNPAELDKTYVPDQNASSKLDATYVPDQTASSNLDATYVPTKTAANARPGTTNDASPKTTATGNAPPKKATTSQLGKYKLIKKLGQGGMGEVFLAEDESLGRKAALKVLSKAIAGNEDFVKRFYKEARAMARVNHDNAVSVYDVGQERGIHYVAMEFVDGKSMQKWMDTLGKLSVGDALHVTLRCAEALQFAHGENLIHRDIKPDNIMLTSKGKVKVADFGLAKATDEDLSMTASGQGLGTPYYMAPEQARNAKHVDGRADVYALGVTLYYFVTGKLPFAGNTALEVITAKEKGKYDSPRKLNPQVPDKLDLMIAKMLEKEADRRCKDCTEVISMLASLGLENPSLSFIEGSGRVVQTAAGSAAQASRPASRPAPQATRPISTGGPKSSTEDAEAQARRAAGTAGNAEDNWIVQFKSPQGKDTIGRLTTLQIKTALKNGTLDSKAKLKKNAAETFMPIGSFPDFERAVEGKNIKANAEQKSAGLKKDFAAIARQYDRRDLMRKLQGLLSGTVGLAKFAIWMGMIFGGIAAIVLFRTQVWAMIGVGWDAFANFYNSFQKS